MSSWKAWLEVSNLKFFFDDSYLWRHLCWIQKGCSKTFGNKFLETERLKLNFDHPKVFIIEIPICVWTSFYPKTIRWSGNVHTMEIFGNKFLITRIRKIFVFSLWVSLIKLRICVFLSFFDFWVMCLGNRARKNLPIDSEILIMNFEWSYDLLYLIWKRSICRTQKYAY